ncbi:SSI family serine proteinase inhibitor [Streptomyces sp. NPDC003035]|uniref:SSI family serine proteinase inhibitor n=1 Tax=unclassified Streptomyces TaxID=2593676 RepID=UPI0033B1194F
MKSTLAYGLAAATFAGLGLGLASAADAVPKPPTRLHLTVTDAEGVAKDVFLGCRPTGGNHPNAAAACDALHDAGGELDKLKGGADVVCTTEYDPVTVTAEGTFNDAPLSWKKEFGNACELNARTGAVFAF